VKGIMRVCGLGMQRHTLYMTIEILCMQNFMNEFLSTSSATST
jgi:hypothetical protein